ncbi:MAG: imidazole glycerol phosphate synthase subunit HisH [Nitrospinota bacterium]
MIAIIDYGMGNLRSVQKGFEKVGHRTVVTGNPDEILKADAVVLPGVGAFKDCMRNLEEGGLVEPIHSSIEAGKPFLGICLGLQLLFSESEEFGTHKGLGVIKGCVKRFPFHLGDEGTGKSGNLKVPHMGWNRVSFKKNPLMDAVSGSSFFYFVHSYYVVPEDPSVILGTTEYGMEFTSAICKDNVFAVQFHPEKSQAEGLGILKRFGDLI